MMILKTKLPILDIINLTVVTMVLPVTTTSRATLFVNFDFPVSIISSCISSNRSITRWMNED